MQEPNGTEQGLSDDREERWRAAVSAAWATPTGREAMAMMFGPEKLSDEDLKAAVHAAVESLIKTGVFVEADFTSPEAYRACCERYGIAPE